MAAFVAPLTRNMMDCATKNTFLHFPISMYESPSPTALRRSHSDGPIIKRSSSLSTAYSLWRVLRTNEDNRAQVGESFKARRRPAELTCDFNSGFAHEAIVPLSKEDQTSDIFSRVTTPNVESWPLYAPQTLAESVSSGLAEEEDRDTPVHQSQIDMEYQPPRTRCPCGRSSADCAAARCPQAYAMGLEAIQGCTTVMLRHVPYKYTQQRLMREVNQAGYAGKYNFFYLPLDARSRANRGFAFINFLTTEMAESFFGCFQDRRLRHGGTEKIATVAPAALQGIDALLVHFAANGSLWQSRPQHRRPVFLGEHQAALQRMYTSFDA